jgi:hypothetical protein
VGALTSLFFKNATVTIFAGVITAIKPASMAINFAEKYSRLAASAMSRALAICEEFCANVESHIVESELPDFYSKELEEFKCWVDPEYFASLSDRLIPLGYCCTQIQKNSNEKECVVWFEPATPD